MRRFNSLATVVLILIVRVSLQATRAADEPPPREAARQDLAKLQGTWILVSMESDGEAVAPEHFKGWHAIYEGDTVTLKSEMEVRRRGIITLDAARKPRAINTWDQDGPYEDQTVPGIYELAGDTLKLCFARPGDKRPTELTTKPGSGGFLLVVYERKKP